MSMPNSSPAAALDMALERARNHKYPNYLLFCITAFIGAIAVCQFLSFLHTKLTRTRNRQNKNVDPEGGSANDPARSWSRLPLAIVNAYRVFAFRHTIELGSYKLNLAEVFITILYIFLLLFWSFVNSTSHETGQISAAYWANRAGFLAACQFPILTALGTKNNIISAFVGLSYDRLNYIHRMMARTLMVLLWIHAGGKMSQGPFRPASLASVWLRLGFVATVALTILVILSLRPIRSASYEVFYYAHFILVLVFLIGAYYHTAQFEYAGPIIASFTVWALDRTLRFLRIAYHNTSFSSNRSDSLFDARAEAVTENAIRLTVRRPSHFRWKAGQTAYLMLPSVSAFPLESHPFTIASCDSVQASKSEGSADSVLWKELVFLINVRNGMTKRLKAAVDEGRAINVLVEGPYGDAHDFNGFNTCTLIAGGTGVSYTLSVFMNMIANVKAQKSICTRILFIWVIRSSGEMALAADALSQAVRDAPEGLSISVRIFVTALQNYVSWPLDARRSISSISSETAVGTVEKYEAKTGMYIASKTMRVLQGRPDLGKELQEEVDNTQGRMSVSVCGSQSLARSVRQGLRFPGGGFSRVLRGGSSVTLFSETFGFA